MCVWVRAWMSECVCKSEGLCFRVCTFFDDIQLNADLLRDSPKSKKSHSTWDRCRAATPPPPLPETRTWQRCRRPRGRWPSSAATPRAWSCSESPCAISRKRPTCLTMPPTPLWSLELLGTLPRRRSTRCCGLSLGTTCCPRKPGSWATLGPRSLFRQSGTAALRGARWAKALFGFSLPIGYRVGCMSGAEHRHKNDRLFSGGEYDILTGDEQRSRQWCKQTRIGPLVVKQVIAKCKSKCSFMASKRHQNHKMFIANS